MMELHVVAITEACSEVVDAGLLTPLLKLLSSTFDIKKEVCAQRFSARWHSGFAVGLAVGDQFSSQSLRFEVRPLEIHLPSGIIL